MPFFPIDSGDTSPYIHAVVIEIWSSLCSRYPAGDGSIAIFRSILPNDRRVGWLEASGNQ